MNGMFSAAEALAHLELQTRLNAAMQKAGVTGTVKLSECSVPMDYYDYSGIRVEGETPELTDRALAWVQKALELEGIEQWHTGAWQGPSRMGKPEVFRTKSYGEHIVMLILNVYSIGD